MGKSRSATVVIAYMMQLPQHQPLGGSIPSPAGPPHRVSPMTASWKQLELYAAMRTPENVEETPAYQRWVYQGAVELSRACGQAPEADQIRFEDEHCDRSDVCFRVEVSQMQVSGADPVVFPRCSGSSCRRQLPQRLQAY